ncbi:hypothetical protein ACPOL_2905 [Acidisarcina polymorpha]|uniref:Uncharacterized protein n=1 Tax=Acidisarcina polymorpha TaxID=2211140 RepID=A0A2Z5FZL6_9BACT|nr:hypothetical protein ACPOL_2905 [Acidisarcina polymorpha]
MGLNDQTTEADDNTSEKSQTSRLPNALTKFDRFHSAMRIFSNIYRVESVFVPR